MSRRDCPCGGSITCQGDCTLPDPTVCFHCEQAYDEARTVDAVGETFCSTFCAMMVSRYSHREGCKCDALGLTLEGAVIS